MATLIYLHGFRSTGQSDKAVMLSKSFPNDTVISPTLPNNPSEVISLINNIVSTVTNYPIIFVGTSLGGFYSNYFSQKYDCPGVLINPSTRPSDTMALAVGSITNHKTNEVSEWKYEYVEKLHGMEREIKDIQAGVLINLFVALDDDVIDAQTTIADLPYTAFSEITETGGHRYSSNFSNVISRITQLI